MQNLGAYYAIKDHIRRELQELYKYLVTRLVNKYYVNLFSFVIKKTVIWDFLNNTVFRVFRSLKFCFVILINIQNIYKKLPDQFSLTIYGFYI